MPHWVHPPLLESLRYVSWNCKFKTSTATASTVWVQTRYSSCKAITYINLTPRPQLPSPFTGMLSLCCDLSALPHRLSLAVFFLQVCGMLPYLFTFSWSPRYPAPPYTSYLYPFSVHLQHVECTHGRTFRSILSENTKVVTCTSNRRQCNLDAIRSKSCGRMERIRAGRLLYSKELCTSVTK